MFAVNYYQRKTMYKILLVEPENSGHTLILHEFLENLSPLLNIKGFRTTTLEKPGHIKMSLLSQPSVNIELDLSQQAADIEKQIEPYIEKFISELSVFQVVDLFLLDRLGGVEQSVFRLKQQIITVFSSRIPVIGAVQAHEVKKLNYLLHKIPIKLIKLEDVKESDVSLQLIKELYDL